MVATHLSDGRELVAVADGMGGHRAGEVASQRALETICDQLAAGTPLIEAVATANATVYAAGLENPAWIGMGTTLVAMLRTGDHYQIVNVGDSRAYRVTAAGIQQITADHSFRAEAMSSGQMSAEETLHSRWRNALTRAVGTEAEVDIDVFGPFSATDPHIIVLCSDGLHGSVADEELLRCLGEAEDPKDAAHRLVDEAYRHGSADNISAAVVVFGGGSQSTGAAQPREVEQKGKGSASVHRAMRVAANASYAAILPDYVGPRVVSRSVWQRLLGRRRMDATNTTAFVFFVVVTTVVLLLLRSLM